MATNIIYHDIPCSSAMVTIEVKFNGQINWKTFTAYTMMWEGKTVFDDHRMSILLTCQESHSPCCSCCKHMYSGLLHTLSTAPFQNFQERMCLDHCLHTLGWSTNYIIATWKPFFGVTGN